MVSASKILTVSYGTFSCTLEGFDDPFSTMRSIAEYFRDLAADDRYFGAEPPTPDAEMLHRIAEREIQRRVEAHVDNNSVVLRQVAASQSDAAATPEPAAEPARPDVTEPVAETAAPEAAPEAAPAPIAEPAAIDALPADSIAAKLRRIRAVVDTEADAATAFHAAEPEEFEDLSEEQPAPVSFDETEQTPVVAPAAEEEAVTEELEEAVTEEPEEAVTEELEEAAAEEPEEAATEEPEEDVTEEPEEASAETEEEYEAKTEFAEHALERAVAIAEDGEDLAWIAAPEKDLASFEEFAGLDEADDDNAASGDDDALAAVLGTIRTVEEEDTAEPEMGETAQGDDKDDDTREDEYAEEEDGLDQDWAAALVPQADFESEDAESAAGDDSLFAGLGDEVADGDDGLDEDETPEAPVAIARVVKVRGAGHPDRSADIDEDAAEAEPEDFDTSDIESSLSEEEEADLAAELAEVEREAVAEAEVSDDAENVGAEETGDEQREAAQAEFGESDASVDRILAETNTKLESTEVTRRRSAIAHLKAAVMATRADRAARPAGDDTDEDEAQDAYRSDLARVVRPRQVSTGEGSTSRRMPPLVLVSEQRVDETPVADETAAPASPVRPRRIARSVAAPEMADDEAETDLAPPASPAPEREPVETPDMPQVAERMDEPVSAGSDAPSFAEFADTYEASECDELMEAAAAYAVYVEGRPAFSRPRIMKMVASHMPEGAFSREDGLRAFGRLLREEKIVKTHRGAFTIADDSRFHPEAKRASA